MACRACHLRRCQGVALSIDSYFSSKGWSCSSDKALVTLKNIKIGSVRKKEKVRYYIKFARKNLPIIQP